MIMSFVVQQEEQDSYSIFIDSLRSKQTKYKYAYHLRKYMEFLNVKEFSALSLQNNNIKTIENSIIKYLLYQRKKGYSYSSITVSLSAILHFYTMNDIVINRKKIGKYLGEHVKTIKDRAYTREEIKKIVDACNLKYKVVVTLMCSSGCRIGAIPDLKLADLVYLENQKLYQIYFYANTKEEYFSFCSYECSKYINEYLEYRKRCGESLTQKSPLIREDFIQYDLDKIIEPRQITLSALTFYLRDILIKTGIRIPTPTDRKRKEISANHGFRKFTHTTMANAKINIEIREMLLGHSIGLGDAYYRPTQEQCLLEYLTVMNDLTIDESHRLQKQVQELKEQDDYQKYVIDKKIKEMEEQNKILNQKLLKYEEHVKYTKEWEQKINDIMESKLEEQHLNREYESIPVKDKKRKDSVFKNLLEIRKKRIKHENDYESLLREHADDDYY